VTKVVTNLRGWCLSRRDRSLMGIRALALTRRGGRAWIPHLKSGVAELHDPRHCLALSCSCGCRCCSGDSHLAGFGGATRLLVAAFLLSRSFQLRRSTEEASAWIPRPG